MEMEMPQVGEPHRTLHKLAGHWTGEEKIHPSPWDPNGGPAVAKIDTRVECDGFFVVTDYVQERGGQVSYRGHGVHGWDAARKSWFMHWFDSMGGATADPSMGTMKGNALVFESSSPMGRSRYTYTLEAEGRYAFTIENSQDGKTWSPFMEGRYTRRG
jgi:hypothetical protein